MNKNYKTGLVALMVLLMQVACKPDNKNTNTQTPAPKAEIQTQEAGNQTDPANEVNSANIYEEIIEKAFTELQGLTKHQQDIESSKELVLLTLREVIKSEVFKTWEEFIALEGIQKEGSEASSSNLGILETQSSKRIFDEVFNKSINTAKETGKKTNYIRMVKSKISLSILKSLEAQEWEKASKEHLFSQEVKKQEKPKKNGEKCLELTCSQK